MAGIKYLYIRDRKNIQLKRDGSYTRGNPIAIAATEIDPENGMIFFSVAAVHPKDSFIKSRARMIAAERLTLISSDKPITDRGVLFGDNVAKVLAMKNGHEITRIVMREIIRLSKLPAKVRKVPRKVGKLAEEYLMFSSIVRAELPTEKQLPACEPESKNEIHLSSHLPHA
jgi:hypothetical protein